MTTTDEKRLYQTFQLIRHLNTPPYKTVRQLVQATGISQSALYRRLELLERVGYVLDYDEQHRYFLQFQFPKGGKEVLAADELLFLQEQLQQVASTSPKAHLATNILHKFDHNLSMIPIGDLFPQFHRNKIIRLLKLAIEGGWCVSIKGYRSMTSNTQTDRLVEPLELTQDFRYCIAWDLEKDDQRQFKLDRIEDVDVLDQKVQGNRDYSPMDIFGLTGDAWCDVKLRLSPTAHYLLIEEFPLAARYIHKRAEIIYFQGIVRHWKGVGRFVLGLPGEIEVLSPTAFQDYLREKIGRFGGFP